MPLRITCTLSSLLVQNWRPRRTFKSVSALSRQSLHFCVQTLLPSRTHVAAYIDYLWWELVLLTGAKVLVGSVVVVEVHKLAGVYTCAQHEMG